MRVSILIPCFNAERFIGECIDSALAQDWPDKDVIVVDDGSTDSSLDIIRSFGGRVRWETGPNRGANAARNRLLELASGEWLQYLDADDYLRPEKIARQLAVAGQHPGVDIVFGPTALEIKRGGALVVVEQTIPPPHDPWLLLARWQLPQSGGPLWRKRALQQVGGWRVEQPCCQEHELYLRLLQADCRFVPSEGCFAVYRFWSHGGRISERLSDEVHRQRLLILNRIEATLFGANDLSAARRRAINDTRHAAARAVWPKDRAWAGRIAESIRASDPNYDPGHQPHSPPLYAMAYRLLGFDNAQRLASWKRRIGGAMLAGRRASRG